MKTRLRSTFVLHSAFAVLTALALFTTSPRAPAQTPIFTNINAGTELTGGLINPVAWADYDNDGRLDVVFVAGDTNYLHSPLTLIYRNRGNGTFTNINAGLSGPGYGNLDWGDYDNDGDLDLVFAATLYRNDGNGSFANLPTAGIPWVMNAGRFVWGDYDNDGRLDVLVGNYYGVPSAYRNNGDGTFAQRPLTTNMWLGDTYLSWGDLDNDGDLDVVGPSLGLYVNNGDGTFTSNTNSQLPSVGGCLALGDANGDGLLDMLLSGWTGAEPICRVYLNDGDGTFTWNTNAVFFPGTSARAVAWGDYDNDGRLDILLSANETNQVWRNNGNGSFTAVAAGLPGLGQQIYGMQYDANSIAWGDYDNDGRLDVLVAGLTGEYTNGYPLVRWAVYRNTSPVANTPPSSPSGLSALITGTAGSNTTVRLSWNAAPDAQTPSAALTYNVRMGTRPGSSDVVGPQADTATGRRRLPAFGNAQHGLTALVNLPSGDYYWSVQAVDTAFAGSAFSAESIFHIVNPAVPLVWTDPATNEASTSVTLQGGVNPRSVESLVWFEYGLTPHYGHQTPAANVGSGHDVLTVSSTATRLLLGMTYHYRVVASNALGLVAGSDMTVTLLGPGQPASGPSLAGLTNVTLAQGTNATNSFTVSDPNTPVDQLAVQFQCNNPVLFPDGRINLGGSGSSRSLRLEPDPNESGSAVIRVSVTDGETISSQSFTVSVTASADAARPSPLLRLTSVRTNASQIWHFRLVDAGSGSTNYVVQYRSDLSPTNDWIQAPNVADRGGGVYEVAAGPPQAKLGFYRVAGFGLPAAGFDAAAIAADEGEVLGPVIRFSAPYAGTVNYTWASAGQTNIGTIPVNGTTAVIPLPITGQHQH